MIPCFRWFGPGDPVMLQDIAQGGVSGIVTSLHHIPCGEAWTLAEITRRREAVSSVPGLRWEVVESLPVHESIKTRSGEWRERLEIYKESLDNLGKAGLRTVCYNFMPVLDWTRTALNHSLPDGSGVLLYEEDLVAVFDIFILRRKGAEASYHPERVSRARERHDRMSDEERRNLSETVLQGLPGTVDDFGVEEFRAELERYDGITVGILRENLHAFLREIMPVAERHGIRMAIHPDDPPWAIFGLPRIMGGRKDFLSLIEAVPSPSNGITLCTGSLGASPENDPAALFEEFAERIHFAHFRNVVLGTEGPGSFHESGCHLEGSADMHRVMTAFVKEEERRRKEGRADWRIPLRPDHGKLHRRDISLNAYPGYSLIGRLIGLAELRGLEFAVRKSNNLTIP